MTVGVLKVFVDYLLLFLISYIEKVYVTLPKTHLILTYM